MPVQNLVAHANKEIAPNEIRGLLRVYRTNQGDDSLGRVGWMPNGRVVQMQDLAVGDTVYFNINGSGGMLANGCSSIVQLIWETPLTNSSRVLNKKAEGTAWDAGAGV